MTMPTQSHAFKRLVLGLQHSASDRAMKTAVEFAGLLNLELLGLFLEDVRLHELAGSPFAREFKLFGGGWQPIELDRLSRDFELAARNAERLFANAARRLPTKWQFEVIRGLTSETLESVSRTGDIVMVVQPASPVEHATRQFPWSVEAAFRWASAVMLVPPQTARRMGPIIAIAVNPNDPAIEAAAAIAIAAKEELVIVQAWPRDAGDTVRELAEQSGLSIKTVGARENLLSSPASLFPLLDQLKGQLLVLTHSAAAHEAALPAGLVRRIPVLLIEPPQTMLDDTASQAQASG
jgi:hypothetical protein